MRLFLISLSVLMLSSCGPKAIEVADAPVAETKPYPSLPLPNFADYPEAKTQLSAGDSGDIYYPIKSPYDFSRILNGYDDLKPHTGKGTLVLPVGASSDNPVPAMVILHGSGGIKEGREMRYAKLFAQNGIAGFVVDYYEPRGVKADTVYQMKTMIATEVDVMSDAYSALKVLGTHPAIDASRIGVTGYSYGGMATRYVFASKILWRPMCRPLRCIWIFMAHAIRLWAIRAQRVRPIWRYMAIMITALIPSFAKMSIKL